MGINPPLTLLLTRGVKPLRIGEEWLDSTKFAKYYRNGGYPFRVCFGNGRVSVRAFSIAPVIACVYSRVTHRVRHRACVRLSSRIVGAWAHMGARVRVRTHSPPIPHLGDFSVVRE